MEKMTGTIADVHCPKCGAPAKYDIIKQYYQCSYCGGKVELSAAQAEKQGFRSLQQDRIRQSAGNFRLMRANCSGCGAELVFEEGEAMTGCAFCGRALVRQEYLSSADMPEMIIPFRITREEAARCLREWCAKNARRPEAKHLEAQAEDLQGFYLPYELIRGPVSCKVSRMDSSRSYHCGGYVDRVFVNASRQLDNLLLDAMEPYELDDLKPFDFAYAAGQRIKIRDMDAKAMTARVGEEVAADYAPVVRKTLETKAVEVDTDAGSVLRMPVLLPVYYVRTGQSSSQTGADTTSGTIAAVNGQTGKVSVRAEKESHYYFLPWWLKAILATLVISAAAFAAFSLFGLPSGENLVITGCLALITLIVTLCAYSDTIRNKFRVESGYRIFTSSGGPLRRKNGELIQDTGELKKEVTPPAFFETIEGKRQPVRLVFSSFPRRMKTALLALFVLFLPVIIALFLNGFDFRRLELGGSAVWFCLMVPVIPIYILKFAVIELYERPWIYILSEDGRKKRYRKKTGIKIDKELAGGILRAFFVPPVSLAVWFGIICFCVMCYLTAFGFD